MTSKSTAQSCVRVPRARSAISTSSKGRSEGSECTGRKKRVTEHRSGGKGNERGKGSSGDSINPVVQPRSPASATAHRGSTATEEGHKGSLIKANAASPPDLTVAGTRVVDAPRKQDAGAGRSNILGAKPSDLQNKTLRAPRPLDPPATKKVQDKNIGAAAKWNSPSPTGEKVTSKSTMVVAKKDALRNPIVKNSAVATKMSQAGDALPTETGTASSEVNQNCQQVTTPEVCSVDSRITSFPSSYRSYCCDYGSYVA